jgi:hypothetical protein
MSTSRKLKIHNFRKNNSSPYSDTLRMVGMSECKQFYLTNYNVICCSTLLFSVYYFDMGPSLVLHAASLKFCGYPLRCSVSWIAVAVVYYSLVILLNVTARIILCMQLVFFISFNCESNGLKSGEWGGQEFWSRYLIHFFGKQALKDFHTTLLKCGVRHPTRRWW